MKRLRYQQVQARKNAESPKEKKVEMHIDGNEGGYITRPKDKKG